jgi:hypothetical protein
MHQYKKGEYRDQFVIAYLTDLDDNKDVILWAEKFSNMLKKGLILLFICDKKYTDISTDKAQEKLKQINDSISLSYIHSYAVLNGKTKDIIHNLGDLLNGVMIVSKVDTQTKEKKNPISINNITNNFYSSRLAYLLFSEPFKDTPFSDVILSMNALKEAKEKILWASYFGRFASSRIVIFYHRYKDTYLQKQLNLNIGFARKMFRKFNIQTLNAHTLNTRTNEDVQAMSYAKQNSSSLCIFQTTKNKSIIELFTGLPEKKAMKRLQNAPILFLNPRDDLFIMCE